VEFRSLPTTVVVAGSTVMGESISDKKHESSWLKPSAAARRRCVCYGKMAGDPGPLVW
jgi:hypothetical protein